MELLIAVIGLFGTVVGAVLGAWFVRRLNHPKPVVWVDELEISSAVRPAGALTTPNRTLISASDETLFVEGFGTDAAGSIEEDRYVPYLDRLSKDIEQAINYTLPSIKNVAERLRDDLTTDDYRSFLTNLSVEAKTIWNLLKHAFLRGDFKFTSEDTPNEYTPDDPEALKTFLSSDPNGAPHQEVIPLVGPRSIIFDWGDAPAHKENELKDFAQRCVTAIAHRKIADINQIINFMLNGQDYETGLTRLREQVRDEQKKHNRLIVKGQVSNTGGSPFSIMTMGKTFILTQGYPYSRGVDNNNSVSNQRTYQYDMQVDVRLIKEGEDQQDDSPISVNAGGIQRFTAVSLTRINDLGDDYEVLLSVFGAGERKFYLGMLSITPGSEPLTPLYTAPQLFRNWRTESEIPPISGWLRRVFGRISGRVFAESLPQGGMAPR